MAKVTQQPVITLEHIRIQFGKRTILEDVSLNVNEGEFIAVLGPNGAGKSTLLKLLLGMLKPQAGVVRVLGRPPRRGNDAIGYAPQHRNLEVDLALRARDVVGVGEPKLHIGKPQFFAIFSTRVCSHAPALPCRSLKRRQVARPMATNFGEVAEWSKAALC